MKRDYVFKVSDEDDEDDDDDIEEIEEIEDILDQRGNGRERHLDAIEKFLHKVEDNSYVGRTQTFNTCRKV